MRTNKSVLVALAIGVGVLGGPAFAFHCPQDMAAIDAALPQAQLTAEQEARVRDLRRQGEELHNAGNHQASVDVLAQAKQILGIQ